MTSQIFNFGYSLKSWAFRPIIAIIIGLFSINANAQTAADSTQIQKRQLLQAMAMQERMAAMQPDSVAPIFQQTLMCLNYAIMFPQDPQTDALLGKANTLIEKMGKMKKADKSNYATLKGFYYTCLIMQNPAQNGIRYYQNVISYLDEALKLNPYNELAKMLKEKFDEGMKKALE